MAAKDTPKLIVYRNSLQQGKYNSSPFVNKLETRLRLAGVPYRTAFGTKKQAPRGKIPFVGFEDSSELIADTTLIIRKFVDDGILLDLNAALTPVQRAQDLAIRALLEEKLYFYIVRERWMDNFYAMRPNALVGMPYLMQVVIGNFAYRAVKGALYSQGTGRLLSEEVSELKAEAWESLSAMLAEARINSSLYEDEEPFWVLGGAEPTEADAVVYAFIAGSLVCPAGPESKNIIRGLPVLIDYAKRIHSRYFSDYESWKDEI
ncbi:hypothetical protein B0H66DRAFT_474733 [Apodospora peruviana]|uniref:Thioredoxin-like fold domain-containing protein n=1 Tax=Apodospora peruviana TaxID=516989 RepID=A0AAE0M8P9_9PEZI|nr:hypothetical protein B0H66DRAFT_474733 [Apodospora peruviana]